MDVPFESLCADEHRRLAAEENRKADEHFAKIRPELIGPGEAVDTWYVGPYYGYGDPYEIDDPGYYTLDPRVHDPNERDVEEARRHRALAQRHDAAAARLHGGCPLPQG
jgi:hypothetical protein